MVLRLLQVAVLFGLAGVGGRAAESTLNETRSTLEKWVETRQLISKTRSDWQSDKEMLEQNIGLFEREVKSIEEQMAKLGTNNTQAEKERIQAEAALKSANESLQKAKEFAAEFEVKIIGFIPQLPAPLQDILKPLLARMPTNSVTTKNPITERIQVLVGILNELDKFNSAVTIFSEKRQNAKGEDVAVETVYTGLGAAYFVNEAGDLAGMGSPGPTGWQWTIKPELAEPVREAVRIYRNEQPARFVSLPVVIK